MKTAPARQSAHRLASTAVLVVLGFALAAATWASGDHAFAVAFVLFYAVAGVIAFLWSGGPGDIAAIMRVGGDERQNDLDLRATAYAGPATIAFALGAVIVQTALHRRSGSAVPKPARGVRGRPSSQ